MDFKVIDLLVLQIRRLYLLESTHWKLLKNNLRVMDLLTPFIHHQLHCLEFQHPDLDGQKENRFCCVGYYPRKKPKT